MHTGFISWSCKTGVVKDSYSQTSFLESRAPDCCYLALRVVGLVWGCASRLGGRQPAGELPFDGARISEIYAHAQTIYLAGGWTTDRELRVWKAGGRMWTATKPQSFFSIVVL